MPSNNHVLILTSDNEVLGAIALAVGQGRALPQESVCRDAATLKQRLGLKPVPLAVVDIDPDPVGNLDRLTPLIGGFKDTIFVVVCAEPNQGVFLKAMQAGVRYVQEKSSIAKDLQNVLRQLQEDAARNRAREEGVVVSILQASGGCGSTTIAVNLANELSLATGQSVLLVDMDFAFGSVATYLDVTGKYGVVEVLSHGSGIDSHLVRSSSVRFADGLHVLLSPASTSYEEAKPIAFQHSEYLVAALRGAHAYTIIDAPRLPFTDMATLAQASDLTLVVLQPLVKDIRTAKLLCSGLAGRRISGSKILVLVNRFHRRQPVPLEEIKTALRGFEVATLSNDFASASTGFNLGKPLADQAKRSLLRRDMLGLLQSVPVLAKHIKG